MAVKDKAGVVVCVATDVLNKGLRLPALKLVTVPPVIVMLLPLGVMVMPLPATNDSAPVKVFNEVTPPPPPVAAMVIFEPLGVTVIPVPATSESAPVKAFNDVTPPPPPVGNCVQSPPVHVPPAPVPVTPSATVRPGFIIEYFGLANVPSPFMANITTRLFV